VSISLFSGCSYTAGSGFELEKNDPSLWVNLLHSRQLQLSNTQLLNVAIGGGSNADIFKSTVFNLLTQPNIKYVFVQWTSVPRYTLSLGLETYSTTQSFIPNLNLRTHNLHNITYSSNYLRQINDRFTALAHDHYEIVNLLYYINSINHLCQIKKCQIFHINGLCPWDYDYFTKVNNVLPSDYTEYTKAQIQIDTRSDNEIFELYNIIHNEYNTPGGIQKDTWINLYSSMRNQRVDVNNDGVHPGVKSNQLYYQQFVQTLDSKLL
jgi:hypothetical protein